MNRLKYVLLLFLSLSTISCGVTYSFTGVGDLDAETFQVNYFQNTANLIEPGFDRDFTLALQDLILNQTNLNLTNSNGDLVYEGEITEYRIAPMTAQANNTAAPAKMYDPLSNPLRSITCSPSFPAVKLSTTVAERS